MIRRLTSLAMVLGSSAVAGAQEAPSHSLEAEAGRFAEYWGAGDHAGLVSMMSAGGIRLHVLDEAHVSISTRQAHASIKGFVSRYSGGEALVTRVFQGGGEPSDGFAEIRWWTLAAGTTESVTFTIFVGFVLADQGWVVSEIRVLP
ncbi:hypothetical protein ACFL3S_13720 [Gemmatimonadota bacterium]